MTQEKIDIVVLWVDGSDTEFIREKQAVTGQMSVKNRPRNRRRATLS